MNIESPFENWRTKYLKGVAFSPEILELVAQAFEAGQLTERNKPVDVNELQERMLKSAYRHGFKAGVEMENEACAKVCEELVPDMSRTANDASVWDVATFDCAAAIRARGSDV